MKYRSVFIGLKGLIKLGLKCKQAKAYKATTNSNYKLPIAENLLEQMTVESG
jgi:hypothetical protein